VRRSGFSLYIYLCVRGDFSLSPYSCAPRRQLESEVRPRRRVWPHPLLPHRRALRRAGPRGTASPRPDSALLDDLHLSTAAARGPSRHCFPLRHAPELPSATGTASFGVLQRRLQGVGPRSGHDGDDLLQLDGGMGESSTKATSVRSDDCGRGSGPDGPRCGLRFFIFKN
jgi:hypothetical protein